MTRSSIILTVLYIFFILIAITFVLEMKTKGILDQKEIDGLRSQNEKERKRFEQDLKLTRDSLEIALNSIAIAHKESIEAHERTQRIIKNYEKIIFVSFSNDAERDSALSKLYPSFRPIR